MYGSVEKMNGWLDGLIKQIDGWLEGNKNMKKQMDGWMDRKNRWMVGWI